MPDLPALVLAELTFVLAYTVFGMVGFGATLVATPILAHVIPVTTLVPAQALTDLVAAVKNGMRLKARVATAEVLRLVPAMVGGSALGAYILFAVPLKTLMLLLGAFVVCYALNGLRPKPPRPMLSSRWAWWFGGSGGVLSALFGAGGWVYSIYLTRRLEDPQDIRATQVAVLVVSGFIRVAVFAVAGRYHDRDLLLLVLVLLPAVALGLYLGNRITLRIPRQRFMQVLYTVLLATGASLIVRAIT